ncbi:DUF397 domain-containing protein [Spirillospora sp. NPDC048911]|uniref:DUF397 domain-containing protein n=1 Tax=Spirillospora sp. NPDC048911 TaxID=3364527 RepID=UPI00371101B7
MDLTGAVWRKSSYSGPNGGNCVEVARLPGLVALRDSKNDPGGPALSLADDEWRVLLQALRHRS